MNLRILIFILLAIITIPVSAQSVALDSSDVKQNLPEMSAAYVVFEGDTLFSLFSHLGPYSPEERARSIEKRINSIAKDLISVEDSFSISEVKNYSLISYKNIHLVSLNDEDAEPFDTERQKLAVIYAQNIKLSLKEHIENKSLSEWLIRIGLTVLTLVGLILIFYLLNRLFKWVNKKLVNYEKSLKRTRKSLFRYLAPKGPEYFFIFLSNIVRFALIILILVLYLPLLFSFLPWTKGLVEQFYAYIANPVKYVVNGVYEFLPNLFFIVIIILIARYLIRILSYITAELEQEKLKLKGFHKDWAKPTLNIVKIIIYAFAVVFMFPYLPGSDSPAFQGVSIFLGVLFSLGSTSAIANIVAGIVITYMRPFSIGDRVKIGKTIGEVVEKTLLVTRIRTLKNEDVTIPNATIINTHLWNYTKNASELGIIIHPSVTIGYDVPSDLVNKLLLLAARNTKNLTRELKPFVLQKSLNDFYVEYELNVYTKQPSKIPMFYSELNKNILIEFNKAGVEILSPHYQAIRDGNSSTLPDIKNDTKNPVEKIIDHVSGKRENPDN